MLDYKLFLSEIFNKLLSYYGPRKWWPAKTKFEMIVGAILTQNVSWKNAKMAINNLKKNELLCPEKLNSIESEYLASLKKKSRFYNQKANKLKSFATFLFKEYQGSLTRMFKNNTENLRKELLSIKGVGEETADCILLYAGNKLSFPSDAYTKRIFVRMGLFEQKVKYNEIRDFFMNYLDKDLYIYNEYHALIVEHGYSICKKKPECIKCPVKEVSSCKCRHYEQQLLL